jgi:hypothetical protein
MRFVKVVLDLWVVLIASLSPIREASQPSVSQSVGQSADESASYYIASTFRKKETI